MVIFDLFTHVFVHICDSSSIGIEGISRRLFSRVEPRRQEEAANRASTLRYDVSMRQSNSVLLHTVRE